MSKATTYKVTSDAGAERYGVEVGETVELDLSKETELAVTAAGWLEHVTTKPKEKE